MSTRDRILDATLLLLGSMGVGRLSLEDVAGQAGVSRQTVYRHFGNRDQLLSATILREEHAFIERILAASSHFEVFRPALEAAIHETLVAAREHPLLDRLLETEPELLLPFLTSGSGPVLPAARPVIAGVLRRFLPHRRDEEVDLLADVCTRLLISYTANPSEIEVDRLSKGLAQIVIDGIGRDVVDQ